MPSLAPLRIRLWMTKDFGCKSLRESVTLTWAIRQWCGHVQTVDLSGYISPLMNCLQNCLVCFHLCVQLSSKLSDPWLLLLLWKRKYRKLHSDSIHRFLAAVSCFIWHTDLSSSAKLRASSGLYKSTKVIFTSITQLFLQLNSAST